MVDGSRWVTGDQILLRQVYRGKVCLAEPVTVVQDTTDLLAVYTAPGTPWKKPVSPDGGRVVPARAGATAEWSLVDTVWQGGGMLRLVTPGALHSVLLFWSEGYSVLDCWYINLEDPPLGRTPMGFDYMDQILDIVTSPDRSEWRWKDEDELAEAVAVGVITPQKAQELYAEGERALENLQANKPPFNGGWERWSPDPSWPIPELPEGWDIVDSTQ